MCIKTCSYDENSESYVGCDMENGEFCAFEEARGFYEKKSNEDVLKGYSMGYGVCRQVSAYVPGNLEHFGQIYRGVVLSTKKTLNWWSAHSWCEAQGLEMVGMDDFSCKEAAEDAGQDYDCVMDFTFAFSNSNWLKEEKELMGLSLSYSNVNYDPTASYWQKDGAGRALCWNEVCSAAYTNGFEFACETNEDCCAGYFCQYNSLSNDDCSPIKSSGTCQPLNPSTIRVGNYEYLYMRAEAMDWHSAKNWCEAQGRKMVSLADFGITDSNCGIGSVTYPYIDGTCHENVTCSDERMCVIEDGDAMNFTNTSCSNENGNSCAPICKPASFQAFKNELTGNEQHNLSWLTSGDRLDWAEVQWLADDRVMNGICYARVINLGFSGCGSGGQVLELPKSGSSYSVVLCKP